MINLNYLDGDVSNLYSINLLTKLLDKINFKFSQKGLPEEEFTSKIDFIKDKSNPIIFVLKNKCKLYFTYSEYRRLHGKPEKDKNIKYSLQKIPCHKSSQYYKKIKIVSLFFLSNIMIFGNGIKKWKLVFGQLKKSICIKI